MDLLYILGLTNSDYRLLLLGDAGGFTCIRSPDRTLTFMACIPTLWPIGQSNGGTAHTRDGAKLHRQPGQAPPATKLLLITPIFQRDVSRPRLRRRHAAFTPPLFWPNANVRQFGHTLDKTTTFKAGLISINFQIIQNRYGCIRLSIISTAAGNA